jgi:hypothetical protein
MLSLAALAAAVVGVGCEGPDAVTDPITAWVAGLIGANEVPAVTTSAAGNATFSVNAAGTTLTYTINITTLPATAITAAHLHQAAAGASAGIAVNLCGAGTAPACATLTAPGALISGGTATITATQLAAIRNFGMYVNVHTTGNPGGEIRGQLRIP